MREFGLIGYPLAQSFSKKYFTEKFHKENISDAVYELFPLENVEHFPSLLHDHPGVCGINVTIPYKQDVISFLDEADAAMMEIGACNCIQIRDKKLKGFNTDAPAFEKTLLTKLQSFHTKALVLGTGGAAKAVVHTLRKLGIAHHLVSRQEKENCFTYEQLTEQIMQEHLLIINTTPLGSYPKVDGAASIPYQYIHAQHYLYDLVYNPEKTLFLQRGEQQGATIKNGYDMLVEQAELSWKIWNEK